MNIANCPRCGKLFAKGIHDVCPACVEDLELQYQICTEYLRENRGATLNELHEATEVPIKQIIKFIREGRINIAKATNLTYPCESCGEPIREHNLCENCRRNFSKEIAGVEEDKKRKEELRKQLSDMSYKIQDRLKKERN